MSFLHGSIATVARELQYPFVRGMNMKKVMCLNCSLNPAQKGDGSTVPLCAECAKLMSDTRGVKYEKSKTSSVAP